MVHHAEKAKYRTETQVIHNLSAFKIGYYDTCTLLPDSLIFASLRLRVRSFLSRLDVFQPIAKSAFITFICLAIPACSSSNKPTQPNTIHFETIHANAFCEGAAIAGVNFVRNQSFSNSITPGQNNRSQPEPDHTDKIKIQINMGRFNTAGHTIKATNATLSNGVLNLITHWNEPAADAMLAQVITQPCVIISLQKQALERVQVFDQHGSLRFSQQLK